jgi:murein DD-endopeptidase MepM/ murein hydrolase activator NlpD
MHPVLMYRRAHYGVDYAAPTGTPVQAIGDGRVIMRGWDRGGGNVVKIKHNAMYTSAYMHLSRFGPGITVGSNVQQGQVVGYVGSTGLSTGPHLDFRIWKNGQPVDPLKVESPPVEPVAEKYRPAYDSVVRYYQSEFERFKTGLQEIEEIF